MGPVNWLAVVLGAVAFFAVGAVWYSVLFGKVWQKEAGMTDEKMAGSNMAMTFLLCFLAELVIAWMLGHLIARTNPQPHIIMMMAMGLGATIMVPATAINYLFQRQSLKLFLIDSGHFIFGMAAMGGVFIALS